MDQGEQAGTRLDWLKLRFQPGNSHGKDAKKAEYPPKGK
jgi:hypothetical protein